MLQTCLNKLDSQTAPMDEVYKKKHAAIYCQLGKHQLHQGMKLNQEGLEKESKTLIRKSKKVSNKKLCYCLRINNYRKFCSFIL